MHRSFGRTQLIALSMLLAIGVSSATAQPAATQPGRAFYRGVDISLLPEIERAGGVFRDSAGKPADAIAIFRAHGVNLFRVRLFVEPSKDFNKVWGATQDLPTIRSLAHRIKAAGGSLLLDLHYSDTWADGEHQSKPRAWKELSFDGLVRTVHDYTASVLQELKSADASPDIVAIGNEIAGGILFPDGRVLGVPADQAPQQWQNLSRLLNAGASAVREASTPTHKIEVMIHIHGGGRPGLPQAFFGKFQAHPVDFDLIGLSVYPAWGDSLEALADNMRALAKTLGKPVIAAEVGYPWKPEEGTTDARLMRWPQTPEGQTTFVRDLARTMIDAPNGAGFIWWYPEAVPTKGLFLWRAGAEALFDPNGKPLPALSAFIDPTGR